MKAKGQLAILDWGIGGIGVYKLIKTGRPGVSVVYFSDTGATPYGKMSRAELVARLNTVIRFLKSKGVSHLVIACNAASTVIPFLDPRGLKIEGVIDGAVKMAVRSKPRRLGLIGGRRTVLSGGYRTDLAARGIKIEQRIAQPLSALIESGDISSDSLRDKCRKILSPLRNCSHILLACTHYPAIASVLTDFVSSETVFLDPSREVARSIRNWRIESGEETFFTTGSVPNMQKAALAAFDVSIKKIEPLKDLI